MISFSSLRKPGYALIGEDENKLEDNSVSHSWKTSSVLLIAVVTAFFAGFGGYLAGNHASLQPEKDWLGKIAPECRSNSIESYVLISHMVQLRPVPSIIPFTIERSLRSHLLMKPKRFGRLCFPVWIIFFFPRRNKLDFPSNTTLYPGGRGFIQNPAISPDVMGVAVYHQLHCLVSISPS